MQSTLWGSASPRHLLDFAATGRTLQV